MAGKHYRQQGIKNKFSLYACNCFITWNKVTLYFFKISHALFFAYASLASYNFRVM